MLIGFPEAMETQTLNLREMDPRGTAEHTGVSLRRAHILSTLLLETVVLSIDLSWGMKQEAGEKNSFGATW